MLTPISNPDEPPASDANNPPHSPIDKKAVSLHVPAESDVPKCDQTVPHSARIPSPARRISRIPARKTGKQ